MRPKPRRLDLANVERPTRCKHPPKLWILLYWLYERGVSVPSLAAANDISVRTAWNYINRGEQLFSAWHAPKLEVLLARLPEHERAGICPHDAPIQIGERRVCCVCFASGYDTVASLQITDADRKALAEVVEQDPLKSFAERHHRNKGKK